MNESEEELVQQARDLLALIRLAAMDGYNEKPVTTVDDWVEECKKRIFLFRLAALRAGRDASDPHQRIAEPEAHDYDAPDGLDDLEVEDESRHTMIPVDFAIVPGSKAGLLSTDVNTSRGCKAILVVLAEGESPDALMVRLQGLLAASDEAGLPHVGIAILDDLIKKHRDAAKFYGRSSTAGLSETTEATKLNRVRDTLRAALARSRSTAKDTP